MEHNEAVRKAIGARVKMVRIGSPCKLQKDFARALYSSSSQISRIERGSIDLPPYMRESLITNFGIAPRWLETGNGDMYRGASNIPVHGYKTGKIPAPVKKSGIRDIPAGVWLAVGSVVMLAAALVFSVMTVAG